MKTVIKACVLVDQTHPLHMKRVNLLIEDDTIVDVRQTEINDFDACIDANDMYVSPGWIDIHVHCFQDTTDLGVETDRIGVESGVVLIVDAGSSGSDTLAAFKNQVKDKKTLVKAWLNIAKTGLIDRHELKDPDNIDIKKTIQTIKDHDDFIVGLKVRASGSVMGEDTTTPFEKARVVAEETNRPIMVHFGNNPPSIDHVLSHMRAQDVLTHCFHGKPNNILDHDMIKACVLAKRQEGVYYDVGHGEASFSFNIATKAKNLGFDPDSISTDLHKYNLDTPVGSLAHVMTKFLNLGYTLEQVVALVTTGPASIINLTDFGSIKNGNKAHLTLFTVTKVNGSAIDSDKQLLPISRQIKPYGCMINGNFTEVNHDLFKG